MKKIILLLTIGVALPAFATKLEKSTELMQLTSPTTQNVFEIAIDQTLERFNCQYVLTDTEKQELKMEITKVMSPNDLSNSLAQFWIDHYTEDELDEIIAFYRTNTGKKTLGLMPEFTKFTLEKQQDWQVDTIQKITELELEVMQKYKKRPDAETKECLSAS